ncbi:LPXTG cell wall anchor domain-containing protein [Okibacterium sp. HSC-33S16]|uniref:LPXTG cell wall anchor domain-containing protein n=1 Tax=Okibacterium sp. HSC-33S16 TaxID=2910965 RepID=UPI0027E24423|nr:LPXTG cell wall anchor domain-containing protein [Okibacterium sp. HSC-33S16]
MLLATAAPASAHAPEVDASCEGISVNFENYSTTTEDSNPNLVSVSIDDIEVAAERFGESFRDTYAFDSTTVGHTYSIIVDAVGTTYDRTFDGTTDPCPAASVPADAVAEVSVRPPTCDAPARLVLGAVTNATWSTPTAEVGPGTYSVIATADDGHTFANGEKTLTFTSTLAGTLTRVDDGCTPSVVVPPKPAPVVTSIPVEEKDCSSTSIATTTTTVSTDWILDTSSNVWTPEAPASTTTTAVRAATPVECPVAVTPPTPSATDSSPVADVLPSTGTNNAWMFAVAGGLLLMGGALVAVRRLRRA